MLQHSPAYASTLHCGPSYPRAKCNNVEINNVETKNEAFRKRNRDNFVGTSTVYSIRRSQSRFSSRDSIGFPLISAKYNGGGRGIVADKTIRG